jgi:CRISPR-associated protein Csb2
MKWATVTPIILPGHDDHKPGKARKLLLAALRQSGIEQPCEITWGTVPNFPHCLSAYPRDRQGRPIGYFRPDHLQGFTMVHARLAFADPVSGPIIVGAGRHCGFGICAKGDR